MTMRRAYLCTSSNHSNGVPKNLLVLNFSACCSTTAAAASSLIPGRKFIVFDLPSSKWQSIDYEKNKLLKLHHVDVSGCVYACIPV